MEVVPPRQIRIFLHLLFDEPVKADYDLVLYK